MAAPFRVLRFPRSDDKSAFVLLQVTSKGSKRLDLKLVGTEGEEPYVASLKHDRVVSLRVKNCPASESEWQKILEDLFQQEPLPDIQATATVQSQKSISITIRKEIQGITQRLGAIILSHDADEAIELFEWCGAAVETSTTSKQSVADLSVKSSEAETAVTQLQSQLEELIKAKDEDETALLRKFRDLLNEKKIKIREQQQALALLSANPSMAGQSQPSQAVEVEVEQPKSRKPARKAGKSRTSKRKAPASRRVEESDDDAAVDTMDVDVKQEAEDTDPGNTTEATASVDSDEDNNAGDGDDGVQSSSSQQNDALASKKTSPKEVDEPPPPRALPFTAKKPAKSTPTAAAGSETESDDEL
ncbi:related to mitotic apparatus protein p62 [Fusarium torulosum]|uniref:Related to mitotic apparatus protein p62 n=1 Tax=Fusarium torulosum TaxID=33205 RepID=A0AAE8SNT3_9HYPO|nr:related to mitotic apparatus protein p62 [Fusarium torulosum]